MPVDEIMQNSKFTQTPYARNLPILERGGENSHRQPDATRWEASVLCSFSFLPLPNPS